jgi:heat shock protein HtpX
MFELIRANQIKSGILIVVLTAVLVMLGFVIGEAAAPGAGPGGLFFAGIIAIVLSLVAYFTGDSIMLSISGAKQIQHSDHPQLFNVVEEMALAGGVPVPKVYIIDDTALNAFATGRNPRTASVAITSGLLAKLNRDELQGVIAHEMGHVKNRDILFMTLAGVLLGTIALLADMFVRGMWYSGGVTRQRRSSRGDGNAQAIMFAVAIVAAILAPLVARLLYLACSRRREYLADATGAMLTRYPDGLASALEKLSQDREVLEAANRATAPMYIVPPIQKLGAKVTGLFSTHPPTEERIAILRAMGHSAAFTDYQRAYNKCHGGGKLVPASALADKAPVPVRTASEAPTAQQTPQDRLTRAHDALDVVRRLQGFLFIPCACGALLKVPPDYTRPTLLCPRCNATHTLSEAKPAPAAPPPVPAGGPPPVPGSAK